MSDEGWESLPGSRRAIQVPGPSLLGPSMLAGFPEGLLLIPVLGPLLWGATSSINRGGGVEVHQARRRFRRGGREVSAVDIGAARLLRDPNDYSALHFQLEAPALAFRVPIHDSTGFTLKKRTRTILLDLLPHTSIEMPTSPYDPKGKFAKYNFPSHLTKAEAIALMQKPPRPGDPLPIPG